MRVVCLSICHATRIIRLVCPLHKMDTLTNNNNGDLDSVLVLVLDLDLDLNLNLVSVLEHYGFVGRTLTLL